MIFEILKILLLIEKGFNFLYNYFMFKLFNVNFKDFQISGRLKIRNRGSIKLGTNFKANSGVMYNPIGGDSVCRLIVQRGGNLIIGNNVGISNSTIVCWDNIYIGDNVNIGGDCKIWDTDFHSLNSINRSAEVDLDINTQPILIKNSSFIGGSSLILKGVTIGENSIIAAGSVVSKDIPDNELWGGNPIRFIKKINYTN